MRILFILENYHPHLGGVEIVFKNLCEGLAKKGHEVIVLTHLLPGTKREETIEGVKIVRVRCLDNRYLFTFAAIPKAIRLAKWADIIHTTTFNGAPPAWLAARVRRKKIIITVHECWIGKWREYSDFPTWKAWMHELLERAVFFPTYDLYSCVSHATATRFREIKPKLASRIVVIHNGFDPRTDPARWDLPHEKEAAALRKSLKLKNRYVIFAYGRPGTSKGFSYLLNAAPLLRKRIKNMTLVLMLTKDRQYAHVVEQMKKHVKKQVATGELTQESVIFIDSEPRESLARYVRMADCVVVPSITEGFGYTTIEACTMGVPVVASNTTSIPEVIYGKHVLVEPKSPQAIANGVYKVYKKKYIITKNKSFPWSKNVDSYEREYRKLTRTTK